MIAAFATWDAWPALTAIGTVGAVIVAVGLQCWLSWRERRGRPKLTLEFDRHMRADETDQQGNTLPYLRLAVTNAEGKDTARDVEILVVSIEEYAITQVGGGKRQIWLANPALAWANSVDPVPRMSIPPGATRYVDVGCWVQVEMVAEVNLRLSVVPPPNSNRHLLRPGGWRLRLAATMWKGDASHWDAEVSFESTVSPGIASPRNLKATVGPAVS
jgi:hypothetical protein